MAPDATMDMLPDESLEAEGRPGRRGRPTRAAAAERDERVLDIATRMFLDLGFEATSMDGLAEAASVGKATLYARFADKGALFAAVLRRRILAVYGPIEAEFAGLADDRRDLEATLTRLADRLIEKGLSDSAITLGRILSAQGPRFPDLARLAIDEGYGRQVRLVEAVLAPFADDPRYALPDLPLAADLFLSLVFGPVTRFKIYGIGFDPGHLRRRTAAGVGLFVRGIKA